MGLSVEWTGFKTNIHGHESMGNESVGRESICHASMVHKSMGYKSMSQWVMGHESMDCVVNGSWVNGS